MTATARTRREGAFSDIWSLATTPVCCRHRWANHIAIVSQMALNEADKFSDAALSCQNNTATEGMVNATSGDFFANSVQDKPRDLLSASAWSG